MELRVLRYYLTVAREENITRAAEILHITQPTLSRQMAELEEELHTRLFDRTNRKIRLTEAGMLLRRRAEELVSLAEKTEQEFLLNEEELSGVISIGCGVSAAVAKSLPDLMQAYIQQYPHVRFELHTGNTAMVKEQLDKGLLDVGILMEPVEVEKYDYLRLPDKDVWGILMKEDAPLANKPFITPDDLQDVPLIMNWRIAEKEARAWFGGEIDQLHVICVYDLLDNALLLVERNVGYAFVIEGALPQQPGLIFRPLSPALINSSMLVWKKYQPASVAVQKFVKLARNAFGA